MKLAGWRTAIALGWLVTMSPGSASLHAQGATLPLSLSQQSFDPALPPVDAAGVQGTLDRDLGEALAGGSFAPQTGAGIAIGVVTKGRRNVFSYGTARNDSLFEIGSITKTFTGLLLAQMVQQDKVKLDEPVRELLPPGTVAKPAGREITLLDLVTQHSGLPRMPNNFKPADINNPYADYRAADLYEFIRRLGVARPEDARFVYSNLGLGLLGQALSNRAGVSYAKLLEEQITGPLGLKDTVLVPSPQQQARFIQGYSADYRPVRSWELDALAGAGAIRSTADDMLTYLEAQLHPEKLRLSTGPAADSLSKAIALTHELRSDAGPGARIGFAWIYQEAGKAYWHNGATGGYSSFALFDPEEDLAYVVLVNRTIGSSGSAADLLGTHIRQRLAGKPAVTLH
jgi:CubicO group peptidase (beta-lactamase class C family)